MGAVFERPVENLAFAIARIIQKSDSFANYYLVRYIHHITIYPFYINLLDNLITRTYIFVVNISIIVEPTLLHYSS